MNNAGINLINASAGSGKTYRLTEKSLEMLSEGAAPESLLVTTFTKKAAAELRERFRRRLLEGGKTLEAQRILDGFTGTLNSVCARLLKEYALEAGLSPALDVLPEEDGSRQFNIAVSRVVSNHIDEIEGPAHSLSTPDWRSDVQKLVELARVNRIDARRLREYGTASWESFEKILPKNVSGADLDKDLDDAVEEAIQALVALGTEIKITTGKCLDTLNNFSKDSARAKRDGVPVPWSEWLKIAKLAPAKDGRDATKKASAAAGKFLEHMRFREDIKRMILGVFNCASESLDDYEQYKRKQGLMDFADQETKVLDILRDQKAFRDSIKDRIFQIMVDEFQDTNPIQLALFLALHDITARSTWVGDPKQAIYGFRGTDAQLMETVTGLANNSEILDKSWRSKELLVNFCNALFSKVFISAGASKVTLKIPDERKDKASGGGFELWKLEAGNNDKEAAAIAAGIRDFLSESGTPAGDVAVLCRKNNQCERIAAELEACNIKASCPQGSLLDAGECQLAVAALRYMQDSRDTLAGAIITGLLPHHAGDEKWLRSLIAGSKEAFALWAKDPVFAGLSEAGKEIQFKTPLEALQTAIDRAGLPRIVRSWSGPQRRMNNLGKLLGLCVQYMDQCKARRSAATVSGFVMYLNETEAGQAESFDPQTVQLLTYHRAKGLEWPVVILTSLDTNPRSSVFESHVIPAAVFNPKDPLTGRSLHFWPWPFGVSPYGIKPGCPELEDRVAPMRDGFEKQAVEEDRRLLYVGMTRAKDRMIFAVRNKNGLKTAWLDSLSADPGVSLIEWPDSPGSGQMKAGDALFPITVKEINPPEKSFHKETVREDTYYLPVETKEILRRPSAYFTPSSLEADEELLSRVVIEDAADFKIRIPLKTAFTTRGGAYANLGNAIHGFFAADAGKQSPARQLEIIRRLLSRWNVEDAVLPEDIIGAGARLGSWLDSRYPGAGILREWPVTLRKENYQMMQGWIDLLIETPEGYVIVDHKTAPNAEREHAKKYAPQLFAYKEAIERATGKKVPAMFIHMPVCGLILEVKAG